MVKKYKHILVCLIFLFTLIGCASSSVKFNKEKIPILGKVGVISVYELQSYNPGPVGLVVDLVLGNKYVENLNKGLREANIASEIMEEFIYSLTHLFGTMLRVSNDEPEIESIHKIGGTKTFICESYNLQNLDYSSFGKKLGIDTFVILKTSDIVSSSSINTSDILKTSDIVNYSPRGALLRLSTEIKMINVSSGNILWHEYAVYTGWTKNYRGFESKGICISEHPSAEEVEKACRTQIKSIVNKLTADFY